MKPLKMNIIFSLTTLMVLMPLSCSTSNNPSDPKDDEEVIETPITFYYGADLSYVNEMEDCGATYLDANNITKDPYIIFKEAGTNLVRVRLWHNSTWTNYSNYNDVKKTIQRAKAQGMTRRVAASRTTWATG
jgi:arabinogalactan endo-1,4-beta-galactosidase